jgi:Mg2+ and Co2+ transporter CorA
MSQRSNNPQTETNPIEYARVERVDTIEAQVAEISAKLSTNEAVGKLFAGAIQESHTLRIELGKALISLLRDYETRESLKQIIKSLDREEALGVVKQYGSYVLGLLTAAGIIFGIIAFFVKK